jgi:cytochrome d ubiquinol oxidase subunit II
MEFVFNLNTIWFMLLGLLFTGYAILDGFDLGVGALHLFTRSDQDRRLMLNAIGPVWDGNEVWLVTGGGAMFAAFPEVYATVFSGFYSAFILLLVVLIFRAVAIEFRGKRKEHWWRQMWDRSFSISSIFIALLMGVALGNIVKGIPLGADHEFQGTFWGLLHPYALLVGMTTVSLFVMHGTIYMLMKTDGDLHDKIRSWVNYTIIFFLTCYIIITVVTLVYLPHMLEPFLRFPLLCIIVLLHILAIANIPREIHFKRYFRAFLSSAFNIFALLALAAIGIFPKLVPSVPNPELSLTIYNASSSEKTLTVMLIIAIIGLPFVLAYTISIYWIFRGKVKLDNHSY